ncbi:hypothetical protein KM043_013492 [Ampulex compressa]|nr:hypothetical protein KM043_013492 [Ampulex compressa]
MKDDNNLSHKSTLFPRPAPKSILKSSLKAICPGYCARTFRKTDPEYPSKLSRRDHRIVSVRASSEASIRASHFSLELDLASGLSLIPARLAVHSSPFSENLEERHWWPVN